MKYCVNYERHARAGRSLDEQLRRAEGLAGGWALDLFIGRESRVHGDIDIAILRSDQQLLRSRLSGRVEKVVEGQLAEWSPTEVLMPPIHEMHVTWPERQSC